MQLSVLCNSLYVRMSQDDPVAVNTSGLRNPEEYAGMQCNCCPQCSSVSLHNCKLLLTVSHVLSRSPGQWCWAGGWACIWKELCSQRRLGDDVWVVEIALAPWCHGSQANARWCHLHCTTAMQGEQGCPCRADLRAWGRGFPYAGLRERQPGLCCPSPSVLFQLLFTVALRMAQGKPRPQACKWLM